MKLDIWLVIGISLVAVAVALEVYDRLAKPIEWWRKIRWPVAGALATVWAILVFRKTDKPGAETPTVDPKEYDDAPERELDRQADNTDLDADPVDEIIDELERAAADRSRELEELRSRSE